MIMTLNEIIEKGVEKFTNESDGHFDRNSACKWAARHTPEGYHAQMIYGQYSRLFDGYFRKLDRMGQQDRGGLFELPIGLNVAGSEDDDNGTTIVHTNKLTRLQMKRAIEIREQQVIKDQTKLDKLKTAYRTVSPLWDQYPDSTFGEICRVYAQQRSEQTTRRNRGNR